MSVSISAPTPGNSSCPFSRQLGSWWGPFSSQRMSLKKSKVSTHNVTKGMINFYSRSVQYFFSNRLHMRLFWDHIVGVLLLCWASVQRVLTLKTSCWYCGSERASECQSLFQWIWLFYLWLVSPERWKAAAPPLIKDTLMCTFTDWI